MHKHPYHEHRQHKVERERVGHIAHGHKHRADGGRVHGDEAEDRKLFGKMIREHDRKEADGKGKKHRHDRPHRAKGGKVHKGKKGSTHVNVIVGGHNPSPVAAPPLPPMAPQAGLAPPPGVGVGGSPPMPPPGGPGAGMPPGMPMRARGGPIESNKEVYAKGGRACRARGGPIYDNGHMGKELTERELKGRKHGGSVKSGPGWEEGLKNGTKVQHEPALEDTIKNMNRKRVVTFATGGGVVSFRARGGPVEASQKVVKGMTGVSGSGGAVGRRQKAKHYGLGKPMKEVNAAK